MMIFRIPLEATARHRHEALAPRLPHGRHALQAPQGLDQLGRGATPGVAAFGVFLLHEAIQEGRNLLGVGGGRGGNQLDGPVPVSPTDHIHHIAAHALSGSSARETDKSSIREPRQTKKRHQNSLTGPDPKAKPFRVLIFGAPSSALRALARQPHHK